MGVQTQIFKDAARAGKRALTEHLISSEAINPQKAISGAYEAGVTATIKRLAKVQEHRLESSQAMREAIGWDGKSDITGKQLLKSFYTNTDGTWNKSAIAKTGAAIGAVGYGIPATVGRIASGGGLYRDNDGKFDVIGVPII